MITYVGSSLFTSPAHVLVNTVNTVGVMGKGIAKDFKAIYPEMFKVYQQRCESGELTIGKLLLFRTPNKTILNFPTKRHWKQKSRIEDIEAGLKTFVACYAELSLTSVAFPQLGCGNGGLDWESEVRPLMERYLGTLPIDIYIHVRMAEKEAPEHIDRDRMKQWLRGEPSSLGFGEVWDDLRQLIPQLPDSSIGKWSVEMTTVGEQESLLFANDRTRITMPKDDLLDVWQRLRTFGLLAQRDLPESFQQAALPLYSLLSQLEYVTFTAFAPLTPQIDQSARPTDWLLRQDTSRGVRLVSATYRPVRDLQPASRQQTYLPEEAVA